MLADFILGVAFKCVQRLRGLADLSVARINSRMHILYIYVIYIYISLSLSQTRDIDLKIISNILRTHVILEFIRLYNPLINLHIYIYP
jgi:hypothetical protein